MSKPPQPRRRMPSRCVLLFPSYGYTPHPRRTYVQMILLNSPDRFVYHTRRVKRHTHRGVAASAHAMLLLGGPMSQHYDTLRVTPAMTATS